jgi:hypothetical protein
MATGGAGPERLDQRQRRSSSAATRQGHARRRRAAEPGRPNLQRYGLGSPTAVIRMMIQQSNCFQVVERGVAWAT